MNGSPYKSSLPTKIIHKRPPYHADHEVSFIRINLAIAARREDCAITSNFRSKQMRLHPSFDHLLARARSLIGGGNHISQYLEFVWRHLTPETRLREQPRLRGPR